MFRIGEIKFDKTRNIFTHLYFILHVWGLLQNGTWSTSARNLLTFHFNLWVYFWFCQTYFRQYDYQQTWWISSQMFRFWNLMCAKLIKFARSVHKCVSLILKLLKGELYFKKTPIEADQPPAASSRWPKCSQPFTNISLRATFYNVSGPTLSRRHFANASPMSKDFLSKKFIVFIFLLS